MISQKCPKCLSSRVRRGYRPTPLWSKILFRYNLLCDNCNWEFKGFAVPGTVTAKPTKNPKKKAASKTNNDLVETPSTETETDLQKEPADLPKVPVNLPEELVETVVSLDKLKTRRGKPRKKRSAKKQESGV